MQYLVSTIIEQDKEWQKKQVFGKRDPVPEAEYFEIYRKTGIDVDNRLKPMKDFFPAFEEICLKYVQYVEELPGFDKLGKADQLSVLKGIFTLSSNLVISGCQLVDLSTKTY